MPSTLAWGKLGSGCGASFPKICAKDCPLTEGVQAAASGIVKSSFLEKKHMCTKYIYFEVPVVLWLQQSNLVPVCFDFRYGNGRGAKHHPTVGTHMLRGEIIAWLCGLTLLDALYSLQAELKTVSSEKLLASKI